MRVRLHARMHVCVCVCLRVVWMYYIPLVAHENALVTVAVLVKEAFPKQAAPHKQIVEVPAIGPVVEDLDHQAV